MPTLLLTRADVAALLSMEECIAGVERAFGLYAEGKVPPPGILGVHAKNGGFHIKAGLMGAGGREYFAAKLNANFPGNPAKHNLPTIQGVVLLSDASNGTPLAVMDSIEVTILRTAAATAVAAKYLARKDSSVATICGCGVQSGAQLRAVKTVLPLKKAYAYDVDPGRARTFAEQAAAELQIEIEAVTDFAPATRHSDVIVTCTPSKQAFLAREHVRDGAFIAGVGADNPEKSELAPELMRSAAVFTDITEQCATIGDLHHAIAAGAMKREEVRAELGEVIAGKRPGRTSDSELIIFDSTGTALQDVAACVTVYEKALTRRGLQTIAFSGLSESELAARS
jgi:alanine dehydrogenase